MAQRISNNDFKILQAKEDSMKLYADKIITGKACRYDLITTAFYQGICKSFENSLVIQLSF